MEQFLPIILQLVGGAVGGNVGGAVAKDASLGGAGNTIAGALGGLGLGQLAPLVIPALTAAAGGGGLNIGNIAASGVGGLVLQLIVGMIKSRMG